MARQIKIPKSLNDHAELENDNDDDNDDSKNIADDDEDDDAG